MDLEEIKKRMHSQRLYFSGDAALVEEQTARLEMLYDFNATRPKEQELRKALLSKMFAAIGENCYIEPPFHANWAGKHVHFGNNIYANFNLTLVDDTDIFVGDGVMFAPNVTVISATHPISPPLRQKWAQYNKPVTIERGVWIGANAVILPGVRIGENSVVGAGSVVTKDVPPNVVAVGCPCRILRKISENDLKFYDKDKLVDLE